MAADASAATRIRQLISKHAGGREVRDDEDVFAVLLLTSLVALQLVLSLEREFGVSLDESDLHRTNFRTVNSIVALLGRKGVSQA